MQVQETIKSMWGTDVQTLILSILQMKWFNLSGPHQVFIILTDDDLRGQNVAFVK